MNEQEEENFDGDDYGRITEIVIDPPFVPSEDGVIDYVIDPPFVAIDDIQL